MTFVEHVWKIPLPTPSPSQEGPTISWVGYFLRATLLYFVPYAQARRIVILALGPGHDSFPSRGPGAGLTYALSGSFQRRNSPGADGQGTDRRQRHKGEDGRFL